MENLKKDLDQLSFGLEYIKEKINPNKTLKKAYQEKLRKNFRSEELQQILSIGRKMNDEGSKGMPLDQNDMNQFLKLVQNGNLSDFFHAVTHAFPVNNHAFYHDNEKEFVKDLMVTAKNLYDRTGDERSSNTMMMIAYQFGQMANNLPSKNGYFYGVDPQTMTGFSDSVMKAAQKDWENKYEINPIFLQHANIESIKSSLASRFQKNDELKDLINSRRPEEIKEFLKDPKFSDRIVKSGEYFGDGITTDAVRNVMQSAPENKKRLITRLAPLVEKAQGPDPVLSLLGEETGTSDKEVLSNYLFDLAKDVVHSPDTTSSEDLWPKFAVNAGKQLIENAKTDDQMETAWKYHHGKEEALLETIGGNKDFMDKYKDHIIGVFHQKPHLLTPFLGSNEDFGKYINGDNLDLNALAKHKYSFGSSLMRLAKYTNVPVEKIAEAAKANRASVSDYDNLMGELAIKNPDLYEHQDKVHIHPHIDQIKKIKSILLKNGKNSMKKGELERLGAGVIPLGAISPKGDVSIESLDRHEQSLPKTPYNVSWDVWNGVQRHRDVQEEVLQLNLTKEMVDKMHEKGLMDTFLKISNLSRQSQHPVKSHTLGWARIDTTQPGHWHIDEIQSDLGQHLAHSVKSLIKQGNMSEEEGQKVMGDAGQIEEIVKGGHEDINHAVHSAVHQFARDNGIKTVSMDLPSVQYYVHSGLKHDKPVPVHAVNTYEKRPKKLGYTQVPKENVFPDANDVTDDRSDKATHVQFMNLVKSLLSQLETLKKSAEEELEKAVLFDYQFDPQTDHRVIYRLQNKNGEGPFQSLPSEHHHLLNNLYSMDIPKNDLREDWSEFKQGQHRFGFLSKEIAEAKIGKDNLQKLSEVGYNLVPVKASKVWGNENQVFFNPHNEEISNHWKQIQENDKKAGIKRDPIDWDDLARRNRELRQ